MVVSLVWFALVLLGFGGNLCIQQRASLGVRYLRWVASKLRHDGWLSWPTFGETGKWRKCHSVGIHFTFLASVLLLYQSGRKKNKDIDQCFIKLG